MEDKISNKPKKLSTALKQYLIFLKKSTKDLTQDQRDTTGPSDNPSTVGRSLIRKVLYERVAVKKLFLRKGNREKRLSYAK